MSISDFFKKMFSPIMMLNCLGVVAATVFLVGGALLFLQCYTRHGEEVEVPNLRGQRLDIAIKKMEAMGLKVEVTDTGYVDTYIGDVILEQSIEPGTSVKVGRVIDITINASTAQSISLPDVADNSSRREAEARLKAKGFKNIRVEYTVGDRDWVYALKVNGKAATRNEKAPVTALISIVVGDGSLEEQYNGNDSLDYEIFGPTEDENLIDESGGESSETGTGNADIVE